MIALSKSLAIFKKLNSFSLGLMKNNVQDAGVIALKNSLANFENLKEFRYLG